MEKLSIQRFDTCPAEYAPNSVSRIQATITARRRRTIRWASVTRIGCLSGLLIVLSSASALDGFVTLDRETAPNSSERRDLVAVGCDVSPSDGLCLLENCRCCRSTRRPAVVASARALRACG